MDGRELNVSLGGVKQIQKVPAMRPKTIQSVRDLNRVSVRMGQNNWVLSCKKICYKMWKYERLIGLPCGWSWFESQSRQEIALKTWLHRHSLNVQH